MVIFNLTILRGVNLVAMDYNFVTEYNSDPYCQVFINDANLGWTPTRCQTLDPIWGGPLSSFRFKGGGGTKITIQLWDRDVLKADDPMGHVTIYTQDVIDSRLYGDQIGYPNTWATVRPPKGYEQTDAGKLQIRLLPEMDSSTTDSPIDKLMKVPRHMPPKLTMGPELASDMTDSMTPDALLVETIKCAATPVLLHVYDVGHNTRIHTINGVLSSLSSVGGIFHGAVEVYGKEYSFGHTKNPTRSGIFSAPPAQCPMHTYRESIYLGDCTLSKKQVLAVISKLKPDWMGYTYHLLRKNCCFFSHEFAIELGVGGIPEWVYSLADIGAWANEHVLGKEMPNKVEPRSSFRKTWESVDKDDNNDVHHHLFRDETTNNNEHHHHAPYHHQYIEDLTLSHVMALRLQRKFRARRDERALVEAGVRRASQSIYDGQGFEIETLLKA